MARKQLGANPSSLDRIVALKDLALVDPTVPTGWTRHNGPRHLQTATYSSLSTGRLSVFPLPLFAGDVITKLGFISSATAAATPTNQWFALYDTSLNLLRQTTDDTTTAWAANTLKSLNLTSSYTVTTSGMYLAGVMVKATTVNDLRGVAGNININGLAPILVGTSSTGLTTAAPNPAGALTAVGNSAYALAG